MRDTPSNDQSQSADLAPAEGLMARLRRLGFTRGPALRFMVVFALTAGVLLGVYYFPYSTGRVKVATSSRR